MSSCGGSALRLHKRGGVGVRSPENHDNTSYAVKEVNKSKRERKLVYQSYSPWSGKEDTVFMSDVSCELEQMTSRPRPTSYPPASQPARSQLNEFRVSSFNWSVPAEFTPTLHHPHLFFRSWKIRIQMTSGKTTSHNPRPTDPDPKVKFRKRHQESRFKSGWGF